MDTRPCTGEHLRTPPRHGAAPAAQAHPSREIQSLRRMRAGQPVRQLSGRMAVSFKTAPPSRRSCDQVLPFMSADRNCGRP